MKARDRQPLVSIIVPAWNAERTLDETLRSAAAQTYERVEIIIVDDGSTDGTAAIARAFCRGHAHARYLRKENGGVASARNLAIKEAQGEWLAPLDADDLWHPTRVEKMVSAAREAAESVGFVYCWQRAIDQRSVIIGSERGWAYSGRAFRRFTYINAVGGGSGLLLARDAALSVGGYDETLRARRAQGCEDMMIQLRVARKWPVAVVAEYLVGWRQHGSNMSGDFEQMRRSYQLVYKALKEEGEPVADKVIRWTDANWNFELAQDAAVRGDRKEMLKRLAKAMRLDPAGSAAMLGYRLARAAVRRLTGPVQQREISFYDADPTEDFSIDPHELPRLLAFKTRLHQARLDRLAALDLKSLS